MAAGLQVLIDQFPFAKMITKEHSWSSNTGRGTSAPALVTEEFPMGYPKLPAVCVHLDTKIVRPTAVPMTLSSA